MSVAVINTNKRCSHSTQHYQYIQIKKAACFG